MAKRNETALEKLLRLTEMDRARAARAARLQTSYGAQLVDAARANAFAATADRIRRAIATEKRRG